MAAPVVAEVTAQVASTGDITPTAPASQASGDLLLIVGEWGFHSPNTDTNPPTGTPPTGWTLLVYNAAHVGSASYSALVVMARVTTADSETMPTISDPGNHAVAVVVQITDHGVSDPSTDIDVGSVTSSDTSASTLNIAGITPSANDSLVLAVAANGRNGNGTDNYSNWTNTNLDAGLTEIQDEYNTVGNGGGTGIAKGTLATAADIGTSTVDDGGSTGYSTVHLGIPPAGGAATVNRAAAASAASGAAVVATSTRARVVASTAASGAAVVATSTRARAVAATAASGAAVIGSRTVNAAAASTAASGAAVVGTSTRARVVAAAAASDAAVVATSTRARAAASTAASGAAVVATSTRARAVAASATADAVVAGQKASGTKTAAVAASAASGAAVVGTSTRARAAAASAVSAIAAVATSTRARVVAAAAAVTVAVSGSKTGGGGPTVKNLAALGVG
jgi:hypothetical protein